MIKEDPLLNSRQVRVPEKPPVHFTHEEFEQFISLVEEPVLKDLFIFAVMTGMRQGEILNLQWSSLDLDQRLIRITSQDGFLTKTGRSRTVPIDDDAFSLPPRLKRRAGDERNVFSRNGRAFNPSYTTH